MNKGLKLIIYTIAIGFLVFYVFKKESLKKYQHAIKLELPSKNDSIKSKKPISVTINKNKEFLIEGIIIKKENFEQELIKQVKIKSVKKLTLRLAENVKMKNAIFVMNIANRNQIKSSLAVRTK